MFQRPQLADELDRTEVELLAVGVDRDLAVNAVADPPQSGQMWSDRSAVWLPNSATGSISDAERFADP